MSLRSLSVSFLGLVSSVSHVIAQSAVPVAYTDPDSGVEFATWSNPQGTMRWGVSLPESAATTDVTDYIGFLECASTEGEGVGWCGVVYGGLMTNTLLTVAYPHGEDVLTSFMWATGYEMPVPYDGDATLTQISSSINETHYSLTYLCEGCFAWNHEGATGGVSTSSGSMINSWAWASPSPENADCPADLTVEQHDTQSVFGAQLAAVAFHEEYDEWAALATNVVPGECGGGGDPGEPEEPPLPTGTGIPVPTNAVYDYVVIGGGAGGIPMADKLSESGAKVLLIEKGMPSTKQWGGDIVPEWLEPQGLTRFDVPGLCNEIWVNSRGIACRDTDQMAGCLLGGGTAINAGLWWNPVPLDWDYNFPQGWKSGDMKAASEAVFKRIPGTTTPSQDGKRYLTQGFNVLSAGLEQGGYKRQDSLNSVPSAKNRTFGPGPFMFSNGERGGPLATYLATANARSNFDMWTNTAVRRIVRTGGHATGVQVENYQGDGYLGTVKLTPDTGRVIVSAGTFGSAKLLMRSGIGPADQLAVVKNSTIDGETMIDKQQWIELPVGYNLEDHTNTDLVIQHPNVVPYDFYEAYDDPNTTDASMYLNKRAGILAQAAPNIGPLFFDEIKGKDGIVRQLQWTARVEGGHDIPDGTAMVISQYLGRGATSRGRMTITPALNTVVSTVPYLNDKEDQEAVITGIENVQKALSKVQGLVWKYPAEGVSAREHVESMPITTGNRRANHWIGTNKMSLKDGRSNNGDGVVDTNTKVYGTDNIFVVDASIFPGMVTTNPSAYIVTVAERASKLILGLAKASPGKEYAQCGGKNWTGSFNCASGLSCKFQNEYYSQCLK
jgi:cellobiose dehydrogenase (acceptor)